MNEDIEKLLGTVTPRGTPPELRARVLHHVVEALKSPAPTYPSRDREGAVIDLVVSPPLPYGRGSEISRRWLWRLDTLLAWAVAGLVLLGVGLNFAAVRLSDARLAAYEPPRPEPLSNEQLVIALAQAGPRTADDLENHLAAVRWSHRSPTGENAMQKYQEFLKQTLSQFKEPIHAACQENTEMDVHRRRRAGGDTTDCQRLFRLDDRRAA
ncbi:MAG TPA: hypothetical protein VJL29_00165 [Thermoguttaceae bacterium]|nr:hypothetical protein [Thermoguttaceae bacterium]